MKKQFTMSQSKSVLFPVLHDLKELSKEADQILREDFPENAFDSFFDAFKEAVYKIRDCTSIKEDVSFMPQMQLSDFFDHPNKRQKMSTKIGSESEITHLHKEKTTEKPFVLVTGDSEENELDSKSSSKNKISNNLKISVNNKVNGCISSISPTVILNNSAVNEYICQKTQFLSVSISDKISGQNCFTTKHITPTEKARASNLKPSTPNNNSPNSEQFDITHIINRTYNKESDKINDSSNKQKLNILNGTCTKELDKTQVLNYCPDKHKGNVTDSEIRTNSKSSENVRLSKKRKSGIKTLSNKKQKLEEGSKHLTVKETKVHQTKPLVNKCASLKNSQVSNKSTITAVITVKPVPVKLIVNKKQQILEEIKKKEKKANENRKKVLAERQLKVEENKKKREEKMEKTAQNRIKLEKEKQGVKEHEIKTATQIRTTPAKKTRVNELIEQSAKEKKSVLSVKQDSEHVKTPCKKAESQNNDNYELTPIPDSSIYDGDSDDEDDKKTRKPIPLWAQGVQLKNELIRQTYCPEFTSDDIFGTYIEPPNLTEIFGVQKKNYFKRTSSANWNTPLGFSVRQKV